MSQTFNEKTALELSALIGEWAGKKGLRLAKNIQFDAKEAEIKLTIMEDVADADRKLVD